MDYPTLEEIKKYLPNNEIGNEKFECIQSVPPRFRDDAYYALEYCEDFKTINKSWSYFIEDIFSEMTMDEKIEYEFGTVINFQVEKRARDIVNILVYKKGINGFTNEEIIEEVQSWTKMITDNILDCVYQEIKERNLEIIK